VADRLAAGDEFAFLEMSRLVTTFLTRWRAYDFRDDWSDIIQETLWAVVKAVRAGSLRDPRLVAGYARNVARHKFIDQLRRLCGPGGPTLAWDDAMGVDEPAASRSAPSAESAVDAHRGLEKLPERKRKVVFSIKVLGMTCEEASKETGIPLGTVKRYLRDGLDELRRFLSGPGGCV